MDLESKVKRQAEFMQLHTLTDTDYRKMIAEKLERAEAYRKALLKRQRQVDLA